MAVLEKNISYKRLIDSTTGGPSKDIADNFLSSEAPKLSFNWTIAFTNRDSIATSDGETTTSMEQNKFAVKTMDRPKPNVEYQDINVYNFRTKVAVKIDYGTVTVCFYDDVSGRAHGILTKYLETISPISSVGLEGADNLDTNENNASIGPLTNRLGPLKAITLTHFYYAGGGQEYTTYDYLNPKFISIDFGNVDMTQSEASMITVTFNFDSVKITGSNE